MKSIVVLQSAFEDIVNLCARFGDRIYRVIDDELEFIRRFSDGSPFFYGPFRRRVIPNHGLGIFYTAQPRRVFISAILDLRQDPAQIIRRLGGSFSRGQN